MLVLTRKKDQSIHIGDDIIITVLNINGDKVSIGIKAPPEKLIFREELLTRGGQIKKREKREHSSESGTPSNDVKRLMHTVEWSSGHHERLDEHCEPSTSRERNSGEHERNSEEEEAVADHFEEHPSYYP